MRRSGEAHVLAESDSVRRARHRVYLSFRQEPSNISLLPTTVQGRLPFFPLPSPIFVRMAGWENTPRFAKKNRCHGSEQRAQEGPLHAPLGLRTSTGTKPFCSGATLWVWMTVLVYNLRCYERAGTPSRPLNSAFRQIEAGSGPAGTPCLSEPENLCFFAVEAELKLRRRRRFCHTTLKKDPFQRKWERCVGRCHLDFSGPERRCRRAGRHKTKRKVLLLRLPTGGHDSNRDSFHRSGKRTLRRPGCFPRVARSRGTLRSIPSGKYTCLAENQFSNTFRFFKD